MQSARQGSKGCVWAVVGDGKRYQPQVEGTENSKGTAVREKHMAGSENPRQLSGWT